MNGWISLQFLTVSNLSSGAHTYMLAPHLVFYLRHHDCADDAPAALLAVSMCAAGIHSPLESPPPPPHAPALSPLSGSTGVRIPAAPLPLDQNFRSKALMNLFPSPLHALAAHPPAFSARADTAAKPKVRGLCMGGWHRHGEGGNLMRGGWVLLRRGLLYAGLRSSTQGRGSVGCVSQ